MSTPDFSFGAHVHTDTTKPDTLIKAAKEVKKAGGDLIQIMLSLPVSNNDRVDKNDLDIVKNKLQEMNVKVVIHASYTYNLARNWDRNSAWIQDLETEIRYADRVGAVGVVLHLGKQLELSKEEANNNMYTSLFQVIKDTRKTNIKILLETSTGQGTEMHYRLEDLAHFFNKFSKSESKELRSRVKLCLDTCHVFAAGYDIRGSANISIFLKKFNKLIGVDNIHLLHLNDSRVKLGDRVDRHESIGKGYIKSNSLVKIFNYFRKLNIPIVLETRGDSYKTEIPMLLSMIN